MRFETQVAAVGVDSVDHTNTDARIQIIYQFADNLAASFQEDLQSGAVGREARPQQVVGGECDVDVGNCEEVATDVVDPMIDANLAAGWAETRLAGKRNTSLILTTRADVAGITGMGITTGHQALNDLSDISSLVWRNRFHALITPGSPIIAECLTEDGMTGGMVRLLPRGYRGSR